VIPLFELVFANDRDVYYSKTDSSEQNKIWKKIQQLKTLSKARHFKHGVPIFVVETAQYRICFREKEKAREILFAGNHKQYEKWYKKQ
jgi:hypothetical protein